MEKTQVIHPELGEGEVIQTRNGGFELLVNFSNSTKRWVRFDELINQASSPTLPIKQDLIRKSILTEKVFLARRMIEAFRLGIVPYDQADQFTFGRNTEVVLINEWLNDPKINVACITGEYGTGKSHLLSYTVGNAIRSGYAVSLVETDRIAVPFYKPKSIYRQIIKGLHYHDPSDGKMKGFRDLLNIAIQNKAFEDHPYFKWFRTYNDEVLWDWISCELDIARPYPYLFEDWSSMGIVLKQFPQMPPHMTAANVYCFLLSSLGWAAKKVLGLSGLLVIFDEAESVDAFGSQYYWSRANNFINGLIRTASNDKDLLGLNWRTGLTYSGFASNIPFLYKGRSELKIMFAFTPSGYRPSSFQQFPTKWVNLENLTQDALDQIFHEICNIYTLSYPNFTIDHKPSDKISSAINGSTNNVRKFVKASVEALDIIRLTDNKHFLD